MDVDDDRLADSVNQEPIVFYDCTQSELLGAMITSAIFTVINVAILTAFFGNFLFALVAGLILAMGVCWGILTFLKNIRQKYYTTWFNEKVFLYKVAFSDVFGSRTRFFNESIRFGKGARRE